MYSISNKHSEKQPVCPRRPSWLIFAWNLHTSRVSGHIHPIINPSSTSLSLIHLCNRCLALILCPVNEAISSRLWECSHIVLVLSVFRDFSDFYLTKHSFQPWPLRKTKVSSQRMEIYFSLRSRRNTRAIVRLESLELSCIVKIFLFISKVITNLLWIKP